MLMGVFLRNGEDGIELRQDLAKAQVHSMLSGLGGQVYQTDAALIFGSRRRGGRCYYRIAFGPSGHGIESFSYQLEVPIAGRERIFRRLQGVITRMMGRLPADKCTTGYGFAGAGCRAYRYSEWRNSRIRVELYMVDIYGQYCVLNIERINSSS